jgi:hypothetical protein
MFDIIIIIIIIIIISFLHLLLFLLVLVGVQRTALDGKKRRITWSLKESLEDMEYADDGMPCIP